MAPPKAPLLTSNALPLGASGTMKQPQSHLIWVPYSISALLGCPAFHVTYGWAHTRSGLGLQSGHGSKRPCPQRTWKAVCTGAM